MRTSFGYARFAAIALVTLAGAGTFAEKAGAQSAGPDLAVVSPNVMLLVDTSGSMELKSDTATVPQCVPATPNTGDPVIDKNEKSRWIDLIEVLSGTINNYSCVSESRSSPEFKTEYSLSSTFLPRDYQDADNYHRPLSNECAPGAGDVPTTAPWDWPASPLSAVKYRPYVGSAISTTATCAAGTWSQKNDGLLTAFDGLLRFGLMTFDTEADAGTGVDGANLTYGIIDGTADYKNGIRGAWSYYLTSGVGCRQKSPVATATQCQTPYPDGTVQTNQSGCCMGGPINCTTLSPMEVGARNAAAPPWEGRMVAFGPSSEDGTKRNGWIQDVIRTSRPFGATPIAGMLNDARDFFWNDTTKDPLNKVTGEDFGPSGDIQVKNSCRQNYIVLLTDGEPNMDLRTPCEGVSSDKCPYDRSEEIVRDLANPSSNNKPVRTFVVGFALGKVNIGGVQVDCKTLSPTDPACANPTDQALRTCCAMNNIAFNGTPVPLQSSTDPNAIKYALFPQSASDLRTALSAVFTAAGGNPASRTYPVSVNAALRDPTVIAGVKPVGYQITSGLHPGDWKGLLVRTRLTCDSLTQTLNPPEAFDPSKGDDFVANVNSQPESRNMITVEPPTSATTWNPSYSVRPYFIDASIDDGVHYGSGVQTLPLAPKDVKSHITAATMGVTAAKCGTPSAVSCANQIVDYMVGLPSASPVTRCPTTGCNVVGDIFHSVPQVRNGIPAEFLRDATYTAFATGLGTGTFAALGTGSVPRDTMVYTSTNDGFLHGFTLTPGNVGDTARIVDNGSRSNEFWAFIPPAVLPSFQTMYPTTTAATTPIGAKGPPLNRVPALDGVAVLRDVVATKDGTRALNASAGSTQYYPYRLERKKAPDASETHTWRTVLTEAFGAYMGGYFALDVTTPNVAGNDVSMGPKFLWQLTTDDAGKNLFGKGSPTPLITTLFVDLSDSGLSGASEPTREVPVAVLPGGTGTAPTTTPCGGAGVAVPIDGSVPSSFRTSIQCYASSTDPASASIAARSLTIVRLDTGQILRTFRPNLPSGFTTPVTFPTNVVIAPLDIPAPIVGQPAAFPGQTGQVADRIFVGDAEGRIWRIDVSKPKPSDWTMNVFFDAYWDLAAPTKPQPVQTPPILSVDDKGQITVAFSTGDQDNLTPDTTQKNYVVSVTETVTTDSSGTRNFNARMNWRHEFLAGEHVLGPMTLFDRSLYYTTYVQPNVLAGACEAGKSILYGEDYLLPDPSGSVTTVGGVPRWDNKTDPSHTYVGAVVSGVALQQAPSCAGGVASTASSDDFLGYGKTTTVTSVNPGSFQLVLQKSGQKQASATASPIATDTKTITNPRLPVRVDSWAPIIE